MKNKSPLIVIFTTVFLDLVGFGIVIPLIGVYGRHFGASGWNLALLGGIYSLMQFFFAPVWGILSDRFGRRPILLVSLLGSTLTYLIFGLAGSYGWILVSRIFGGVFAANISTAQAYIADVTKPEDRAKGMGLIGAAFGIGFTLGPPLGGIAAAKIGLHAPGLIAFVICALNLVLAYFRLPESLPVEKRIHGVARSRFLLSPTNLRPALQNKILMILLFYFFFATFAFSNMEQTFSLLFQYKFGFDTAEAGYRTGMILMFSGILGAIIQGGFIKKLVTFFGEYKLIIMGLILNAIAMGLYPLGNSYGFYFIIAIPLALASSFLNPSLSAMISKNAPAHEQGMVMGLSQGLGSLARAFGPFCGLLAFDLNPHYPFWIACFISMVLFFGSFMLPGIQRKSQI